MVETQNEMKNKKNKKSSTFESPEILDNRLRSQNLNIQQEPEASGSMSTKEDIVEDEPPSPPLERTFLDRPPYTPTPRTNVTELREIAQRREDRLTLMEENTNHNRKEMSRVVDYLREMDTMMNKRITAQEDQLSTIKATQDTNIANQDAKLDAKLLDVTSNFTHGFDAIHTRLDQLLASAAHPSPSKHTPTTHSNPETRPPTRLSIKEEPNPVDYLSQMNRTGKQPGVSSPIRTSRESNLGSQYDHKQRTGGSFRSFENVESGIDYSANGRKDPDTHQEYIASALSEVVKNLQSLNAGSPRGGSPTLFQQKPSRQRLKLHEAPKLIINNLKDKKSLLFYRWLLDFESRLDVYKIPKEERADYLPAALDQSSKDSKSGDGLTFTKVSALARSRSSQADHMGDWEAWLGALRTLYGVEDYMYQARENFSSCTVFNKNYRSFAHFLDELEEHGLMLYKFDATGNPLTAIHEDRRETVLEKTIDELIRSLPWTLKASFGGQLKQLQASNNHPHYMAHYQAYRDVQKNLIEMMSEDSRLDPTQNYPLLKEIANRRGSTLVAPHRRNNSFAPGNTGDDKKPRFGNNANRSGYQGNNSRNQDRDSKSVPRNSSPTPATIGTYISDVEDLDEPAGLEGSHDEYSDEDRDAEVYDQYYCRFDDEHPVSHFPNRKVTFPDDPSALATHIDNLTRNARGGKAPPSPFEREDWQLNPSIAHSIFQVHGVPDIDLMASAKNRQVEQYFSKEMDALSKPWNKYGIRWINPPWNLVDKVIDKIVNEEVGDTLIVCPIMPSHNGSRRRLERLSTTIAMYIPHTEHTYIPPSHQHEFGHSEPLTGVGYPNFKASAVYKISGIRSEVAEFRASKKFSYSSLEDVVNSLGHISEETIAMVEEFYDNSFLEQPVEHNTNPPRFKTLLEVLESSWADVAPELSDHPKRPINTPDDNPPTTIKPKPAIISLKINDIVTEGVLDSGAGLSCISRKYLGRLFTEEHIVNSPTIHFRGLAGGTNSSHSVSLPIIFLGNDKGSKKEFTVRIKFRIVEVDVDLIILGNDVIGPLHLVVQVVPPPKPSFAVSLLEPDVVIAVRTHLQKITDLSYDTLFISDTAMNNPASLSKLEVDALQSRYGMDLSQSLDAYPKELIQTFKSTENPIFDFDCPKPMIFVALRLLLHFHAALSYPGHALGFYDKLPYKLSFDSPAPVRKKHVIRYLPKDAEIIKEQFKPLLEAQPPRFIYTREPPYTVSRVHVVKAAAGRRARAVIDYRAPNALCRKDLEPIPTMISCLDFMGKRNWNFSLNFDLNSMFHQIAITDTETRKFLAIQLPDGIALPTAMPQGTSEAPAHACRVMNQVLEPIKNTAVAYIDDVYSNAMHAFEALQRLGDILQVMSNNGLTFGIKKLRLFFKELKMLGFVVTGDGKQPDQEKVSTIRKLAYPQTLKLYWTLYGLLRYFANFVPNFTAIIRPVEEYLTARLKVFRDKHPKFVKLKKPTVALDATAAKLISSSGDIPTAILNDNLPENRLKQTLAKSKNHSLQRFLNQDPVLWSREMKDAVDELTEILASGPVLTAPQANSIKLLHSDGSYDAFGALLEQFNDDGIRVPILMLSRTLQKGENNYSPNHLEAQCLVWAYNKCREYMGPNKSVAFTDHKALSEQSRYQGNNRTMMRLAIAIQEMKDDCVIHYKPGCDHIVPDALSRLPQKPTDVAITLPLDFSVEQSTLVDPIKAAYEDDQVQTILKQIQDKVSTDFKQLDGVIYKKTQSGWKMFIPDSCVNLVLTHYHDTSGHINVATLLSQITSVMWWRRMIPQTRNFVKSCTVCQLNNYNSGKQPGLLHPTKAEFKRHGLIHVDFAFTGKDASNEYDSIMVISDGFSDRITLAAVDKTYSGPEIARTFLEVYYKLFGIPDTITSDRDPRFTSDWWQEFGKIIGVNLRLTTAHHQSANGGAEAAIKQVKLALRLLCLRRPRDWPHHLAIAEFTINQQIARKYEGIEKSRFEISQGWLPKIAGSLGYDTNRESSVTDFLKDIKQTEELVTILMDDAAEDMANYRNSSLYKLPLKPGDLVKLSTKHISGYEAKSALKWLGPIKVLADRGFDTYQLDMPPTRRRIHDEFHVSKLRLWHAREGEPTPNPPPLDVDGVEEYEVEAIISHGTSQQGNPIFQVKYKGYIELEWELATNMNCPDLIDEYWKKVNHRPVRMTGNTTRKTAPPKRTTYARKGQKGN